MKESNETKTVAKHLGFDRVVFATANRYTGKLQIFSGEGSDEGAYYPAKDITVSTIEGIRALHELTTEILSHVDSCEELAKNLK